MKKYVISRKEVCAGGLLQPFDATINVYDENGNIINDDKIKEFGIPVPNVSAGVICRGMLFNVNEDGLANDLVYNTPCKYSIEGIQSKIDVNTDFIITNYVELEELLKYLKYGVDLTQNDLNKIYRTLICNNRWLNHHMELFGWIKNDIGYSRSGNYTISPSIYDNLSSISCTKDGRPYKEEPGYKLIKRKR